MEFEKTELTHEIGYNFINYAMAVNTDRSIPDATTGLKPVHKRILYCALVDGNTSNKNYIKCANNVGSMLAKWHPHGDTSVYDALVRLSQPWVMRYPLIDFHGNNGNEGGDGPAHYRYTECRLAKISEDGILKGVKEQAVDFVPNFDGTQQEPATLPAVFPNLLCNPNGGIGVSLACSWAPHNLREVAAAIIDYLDGKEPMLPGPDFPTGGIIINKDDIPKIMSTGRGSVKIRAKHEIKDDSIVFTEIPYGVSTESVMKQLNEIDESLLEGVIEIRDDSDRHGVQVSIDCKPGANFSKIINTIFQETDMQSSFSYNQVALVKGEPKLINLKECIEVYVNHNYGCLIKRFEFLKGKYESRLEIVDGLLKALEDIDNIIALIKSCKYASDAKEALMAKYNFSEPQAKAITDLRLAKLAGLEKIEIEDEKKELVAKIEHANSIITNQEARDLELRKNLNEIVNVYGDERRTSLTQVAIEKKKKEQIVVEPKDCVVIINKKGAIKRVDAKSFKPQKRNTAGVKTNGDVIVFSQKTNTQDTLMVFSSKGKMYRLLVDNIPEGTNTSTGTPLSGLIKFEDNEVPMAFTTLARDTDKEFIFFVTKKGIVKKVFMNEYDDIKRTGVVAIKFKEGDELAAVTFINKEPMMLLTKNGMSIRFETAEMPISSRISQGVKGMNIAEDDYVVSALPITNSEGYLAVVSETGLGKKTALKEFTAQNRGGKGLACYKGKIAGGVIIDAEREMILISGNSSSIVIDSEEMPSLGRTSAGNIMLKNNDTVVSIAKV